MNKKILLKNLKQFKNENGQQYGIDRIGLFGSYSKNVAQDDSDVDVVVHLAKQDLFNIIGIKQDLEEVLHLPVDVVSYRMSMDKLLKAHIDRDAEYV